MQPIPDAAPETIAHPDTLKILVSAMTEAQGHQKLLLGLSTGAVVLFVNLVASRPLPRVASWLMVGSIFSFGASAICSLLVHGTFVATRMAVTGILANPTPPSSTENIRKIRQMEKQRAGGVYVLGGFLVLGLLSAMASVVAIVLAR